MNANRNFKGSTVKKDEGSAVTLAADVSDTAAGEAPDVPKTTGDTEKVIPAVKEPPVKEPPVQEPSVQESPVKEPPVQETN